MNDHRISISREELYEKVWTIPMQRLAPRFGLSDVGLAAHVSAMALGADGDGVQLLAGWEIKTEIRA